MQGSWLVTLQDGASGAPLSRATLGEGDYVVVRGNAEAMASLATKLHLALATTVSLDDPASRVFGKKNRLAEVVIPAALRPDRPPPIFPDM